MKVLALIGTAVGSLAVGALAAGWLVMLTPAPAHSLQTAAPAPAEARAVAASPPAEAPPAAPPVSRRLATLMASEPAPPAEPFAAPVQPPAAASPRAAAKPSARPAAEAAKPAAEAAKPPAASAKPPAAPAKHRFAKVASLVALRGAPGVALQASPNAVAKANLRPEHHLPEHHLPDRHLAGLLTPAEVGRIRAALRLSPDQEAQWAPVGEMLRRVGRQQMAAARNGEEFNFASSGDLMGFYAVAAPLLRGLREDQKAEVRALARRMGFGSYAAYI